MKLRCSMCLQSFEDDAPFSTCVECSVSLLMIASLEFGVLVTEEKARETVNGASTRIRADFLAQKMRAEFLSSSTNGR